MSTMTTTDSAASPASPALTAPADPALGSLVRRVVGKRHFASLATASARGRVHGAGVLYQLAAGRLWISTLQSSRKAANVAATGRAAVVIPVRRLPIGPPASVQMQCRAEIVPLDDPELCALAERGQLDDVTGHGELDLDGGCFLQLTPPERVPVYGLGMSLLALLRDPLGAGRVAAVDWGTPPAT